MNLTVYKNRLRQKATIRLANKPYKTLRLTFLIGVAVGAGIASLVSFFI